jgi:hypothetical protein
MPARRRLGEALAARTMWWTVLATSCGSQEACGEVLASVLSAGGDPTVQ